MPSRSEALWEHRRASCLLQILREGAEAWADCSGRPQKPSGFCTTNGTHTFRRQKKIGNKARHWKKEKCLISFQRIFPNKNIFSESWPHYFTSGAYVTHQDGRKRGPAGTERGRVGEQATGGVGKGKWMKFKCTDCCFLCVCVCFSF